MTIRTGDPYVIETLDQFKDELNADWLEIAEALPADHQDNLITSLNEERNDSMRISDVSDIHPEDVVVYVDAEVSTNQVIQHVLDARDREYTHMFDGVSVHRILELHPLEAEPKPTDDDE